LIHLVQKVYIVNQLGQAGIIIFITVESALGSAKLSSFYTKRV